MWCSRAGRRRATRKWCDLLVNCTDGVISMPKFVGTASEVTREVWEMMLLTLWPRLELGSSGTSGKNANRDIWKPWFVRVCGTCCFGRWLQSLFSTLLQLDVRSQSLCGLCMVCKYLLVPRCWCSVAVSANPWFDVHFVLWVTATQLLIMFLLSACSFQLEYCYLWCSLFWLACWLNFPVRHVDSGASCVVGTAGFHLCHSAVFRVFVESFVDQVGLGLSPCLMDKYFWEHIQIYLVRDDLLCLRVVARFHATCEWFGPGWTVALSPGYTWYDGRPGINRKTCRGSPGVSVLEKCASFTMAECALLLESLDLVHGMFCKRHLWFEKLSVLSLGEASDWMFRDFKSLLYGSFEAVFLLA